MFFLGGNLGWKVRKNNTLLAKIVSPVTLVGMLLYLVLPVPTSKAGIGFLWAFIGYVVGYISAMPKPISFDKKLIVAFIAECIITIVAAMIEEKPVIFEIRSMYSLLLVTLICYLVTLIAHELLRMRRGENITEK